MKHLLNTLFVTTAGAYVCKEGETIVVKADNEVRIKVPIHNVGSILCFGHVSCSPALMGHCGEQGVSIAFFSEYGRFLARVQGPVSGNVLLRRQQYRMADDAAQSAGIAKAVLLGKVANCRTVLQRRLRDHPESPGVESVSSAVARLGRLLDLVPKQASLDAMRGIEGDAARIYFEVFDHLITSQKESFSFTQRSRRPPLDRVNALLSFVYSMLAHDVASALEGVGLDPAVGFLHRDRPGRPGLALDIMEEFRPCFADRLVLSLINLRQVTERGFERTDTGEVRMDDDTRKEVLKAFQTRKQETIVHPFIDEKVETGMLFHVQALLMARHVRGDLDGYPPFIWR